MSASALGDASGTLKLMSIILASGEFNATTYYNSLKHLGILAKKDENPQAMMLLGKILLGQQKERDALVLFRKATRGSLDFEGAADALVNIGRILLKDGDKKGAEVILRKAALELDDPSAYFYLSKTQAHASPEQKVYLLKAAASGIVEAHHNLGAIELAWAQEKAGVGKEVPVDYRMAKEWFEVAAAEGFGLSMLNLALICKATGNIDEGRKWLERAKKVSGLDEIGVDMQKEFT